MVIFRARLAGVTALAALAGGLLTAAAAPAAAYSGPANEISYVGANGEVYTELPDGSRKTQITSGGASKKCDPAFSPDHTQIAYVGNDGGVYVIANAPQSASNVPTLLNSSISGWQNSGSRRPTWSPDGLTIVFPLGLDVRPTSHTTDIYNLYEVTRAAGGSWSDPVQLTDLPVGGWALQPRLSPSGSALSYSYRAPSTSTDVLYVSDWPLPGPPATTPPGTAMPRAGEAILSSWSPDGTKIAYGAYTCSVGVQVLTVSRSSNGTWTGGRPSTVTNGGGCGAAWSSTNANLITYADSSNVYVVDLTKGRKGVNLGAGSQPGW